MQSLIKENGFTIVEVLVALAILMIIIFSFTLLFTSSFSGIARAGKVSEELFRAQKDMDNKIVEAADDSDDVVYDLEIIFPNGDDGIRVEVGGREKQVPYQHEERSGTLFYFLPDGH